MNNPTFFPCYFSENQAPRLTDIPHIDILVSLDVMTQSKGDHHGKAVEHSVSNIGGGPASGCLPQNAAALAKSGQIPRARQGSKQLAIIHTGRGQRDRPPCREIYAGPDSG